MAHIIVGLNDNMMAIVMAWMASTNSRYIMLCSSSHNKQIK